MSQAAFVLATNFEPETCCNCSMQFAMTADFQQARRRDGKSFYCPQGHPQHYTEPTEAKLRKQLAEAERQREWHKTQAANERAARERTEHQVRAQKAAKTRLKNRIKHGVCPCCTRTFQNLADHMKTQHPEFQEVE